MLNEGRPSQRLHAVIPLMWLIHVLEKATLRGQKPDEWLARVAPVVGSLGGHTKELSGGIYPGCRAVATP